MKKGKIKILELGSLTFLISMIVIGFVAGAALYIVIPPLPREWRQVVQSSANAVELLAYQYPNVYVEAANGEVYACETQSSDCVPVDELPETASSQPCGSPNTFAPFPPGKVVDRLSVRSCGIDGYVDMHFALLDNNSIWECWAGRNANNIIIFGVLCGLIGALLAALTSLIVLRLRHRRDVKF